MKTQPKKRGRPVGSKKAILLPEYPEVAKFITGKIKEEIRIDKALHELPDSEATVEQVKDWGRYNHDWQEGFDKGTVTGYESAQSDMKLANKITLVLTVVNVAILISLVIKNV